MAISGGDGSIILTTKVDEKGVTNGLTSIKNGVKAVGVQFAKVGATMAKTFLAMGVAATATAVSITKQAVQAYADYEQLVGGIETLFKGSSQKVIDYANDAFYTAGVSANEYMQQVTSFSASLIRSTVGDTDKAADIANMALIDISDNVNKMGSSMESVTLAYQGFAKQQYMLLDNLKLGYGGTKTEMERLLKDAQALTGVKYDINNLADVYSAIHAIQEELGITGTTAKEAEKTISGSAKMMKAAWKDVLASLSGSGDINRAINNFAYSVQKFFNNIVPVVERALNGIGTLIAQLAPTLVQTIVKSFIKSIPSLINSVYNMMLGVVNGANDAMDELGKSDSEKQLEKQAKTVDKIAENQKKVKENVEETEEAQKKSLANFDEINTLSQSTADVTIGDENNVLASPTITNPTITPEVDDEPATMTITEFIDKLSGELLPRVVSLIGKITTTVVKALPKIITSIAKNSGKILDTIVDVVEDIVIELPTIIKSLTDTFPVLFPQIFSAIVNLIDILINNLDAILEPIIDSIPGSLITITQALTDNLPTIISGIIKLVMSIVENLPKILQGIADAVPTVIELLITALLENLPLIIWGLIKVVGGIIASLPEIFGSMIDAIVGVFVGIWNALKNVFGSLGNWISKHVTEPIGNFFAKMWEGIKDGAKAFVNFFIDIINKLIGGFESFVNFFVKAINWIISGLNKISFDVPDWVPGIGGKSFGFNISEVKEISLGRIPRLAQGAVIPPNREFMAVLGDQKHGTNIEAPLDTIKQAVAEVLAQVNIGSGSNGRIEIPVIIDGREIARAVREAENNMGSQTVFGGFANVY